MDGFKGLVRNFTRPFFFLCGEICEMSERKLTAGLMDLWLHHKCLSFQTLFSTSVVGSRGVKRAVGSLWAGVQPSVVFFPSQTFLNTDTCSNGQADLKLPWLVSKGLTPSIASEVKRVELKTRFSMN